MIIVIGVSIALGVICGSGSVYAFNHIPDEWLGADESGREWQRVKSVPWKYIFTATFIVIGIYIGICDPQKAAGIYAACLVLTQIAMAALLYGRTPRPLVWLLALTGIGIIPFSISEALRSGSGIIGESMGVHPETMVLLKVHVAGAAAGFLIMLILLVIKKIIFSGAAAHKGHPADGSAGEGGRIKRTVFPGIDWQLCELGLVLGLICGWKRVLTIIACGLIFWGGYVLFKKSKREGIIDQHVSEGEALEKRSISENFFITVSAVLWMIAGTGLDITVI